MDRLQSDLSHHHRVEYASPTFGQPSTAAVADVCSSPSYQEFRNSGMSALCPLCVLYVCPVCILRTDLFAIPEFLNTGATTYIRYSCRARLAERRGGVLYPVMMSEVALKSVHVLPILMA